MKRLLFVFFYLCLLTAGAQSRFRVMTYNVENAFDTIHDEGKQDLQAWLESPEAPSPQLQATMYIKAVLAILKDGDASPYLDNQRQAHIQRMRELTAQRRDSSLSDMLLIDHALYHLEADLRWIELTISRLTRLKEEILHEQTNN